MSVSQYLHGGEYPSDFPLELPADCNRVLARGNSVIIDGQSHEIVAGPLIGQEGILVAECDLRGSLREKQWFDVVGHYSREDVLLPLLHADERT